MRALEFGLKFNGKTGIIEIANAVMISLKLPATSFPTMAAFHAQVILFVDISVNSQRKFRIQADGNNLEIKIKLFYSK